jgi:pimeloyl-[acyl-carrier protein] synthase
MSTPLKVTNEPLAFHLLDPDARRDPYPLYRAFREAAPVHRSDIGFWSLTRYHDVLSVLRDPRFSVDPRNASQLDRMVAGDAATPNPIREVGGRALLFTDPPDHTRIRGLVNKAFTARVVEGLRPRIRTIVDELLDAVAGRETIDVIADLAYPLPVNVICEMIGVPREDQERFRGLSAQVAPVLDPLSPPDRINTALEGLLQFALYFNERIEERRSAPRDDLLSALIAAEDEQDRLSHEELIATCVLVFIAGHETTQNLIGNGLLALLRNPEELETLRADRGLVRGAIEELLRYDSPVQLTARHALEELEIDGHTIPKGAGVVAFLGAGNRDPAVFVDPERLDVRREKVSPLSFGAGVHFCLGAPLARAEAQIVFDTLLERYPSIELATDEPEWRDTLTLRGLRSLPVRVR